MANLLYNKNTIIGRIFQYFQLYFYQFSIPTMEHFSLLALAIIAVESADSIQLLYNHFLSKVTQKSLNTFYYACSYAKINCSKFMNVTIRLALGIILQSLQTYPVFLCIDDTMIPKFGQKFEHCSKLFDHAAHNGSNYLNGHCFVSLMSCVPVWEKDNIVYLSLPLGYRMWTKDISKLELAASMVRTIMSEFKQQKKFWSLCDYRLRSQKGIETWVNLITICYCAMKLLPYKDDTFSEYKNHSVQEFRFVLSEQINQQIIFAIFVKNVETTIKSNAFLEALKSVLLSFGYYG